MDFKLILEFTKNLDVLYVEDNKILRESTRLLLGNFFAKVDVGEDGREGLELYKNYFKDNKKHYDLIITDIDMPNMDGLEMSKEIYKLHNEQEIIIVTAHKNIDYFLDAINMGCSSFILKPISKKKMAKIFYKVCQNIYNHQFVLEHDYRHYRSKSTKVIKDSGSAYFMGQVEELVDRDLCELVTLHNKMDEILVNILTNDFDINILKSNLPKLSTYFNQYALILSFYTFFDSLSRNISIFSDAINNTDSLVEQRDKYSDVFALLESFLFILQSWQNELPTYDHHKIDYYNSSIVNDMTTISNMWRVNCIKEEEVVR